MTRIGSLFTGYGGLDMAVGGDLAWYSEIEPAACTVLASHYSGMPNLGDITAVDWSAVEPVDVITGGYPCQPFSNAGKRKGTKDERHLWPYVRDAISALRPSLAVLENVRGHLSLGLADVIGDLAGLGYDARWGVVRASDAGAPHGRARVFITAYPHGTRPQGSPDRSGQASAQRHGHVEQGTSAPTANASSERHGGGERSASLGRVGCTPEGSRRQASATWQESGTGSVEDAWDSDSLNDAPQQTRHRESAEPQRDRSNGGQGYTDWGQYEPAIQRWGLTIGRPAPAPTVQRAERDRLNPAFVEWMMGLPEGHVTGHGLSAAQELKMLGNGVVPQQAALALRLLGVR